MFDAIWQCPRRQTLGSRFGRKQESSSTIDSQLKKMGSPQALVLYLILAISRTDCVRRQTYLWWLSAKFIKVPSSYQFPERKKSFLKTF